jgi:group I intron endonuclease
MRGIYTITNILTDTVYYGQSKNIKHRLNQHISDLKDSDHHNIYLQNSWNKYGESAFVFTPIQIIEDMSIDLTPIEKKYTKDAYSLGLNIFNIREPELKAPLSEETKKKMSAAGKEKIFTETHKKNISSAKIGNKSRTGLKNSDHQKQVMKGNKFGLGYKHTPEELKQISEASKGRQNLGYKHTEEWKQKNSIRMKQFWTECRAAKGVK